MFVVISFPTSFYRILIVNETISKLNFPFDHEKSVCAHKTSNLINPFYFLVKASKQAAARTKSGYKQLIRFYVTIIHKAKREEVNRFDKLISHLKSKKR